VLVVRLHSAISQKTAVDIIRGDKMSGRETGRARSMAHIRTVRNVRKILIGKLEGEGPLRSFRCERIILKFV
jgi:hypothetical protein